MAADQDMAEPVVVKSSKRWNLSTLKRHKVTVLVILVVIIGSVSYVLYMYHTKSTVKPKNSTASSHQAPVAPEESQRQLNKQAGLAANTPLPQPTSTPTATQPHAATYTGTK